MLVDVHERLVLHLGDVRALGTGVEVREIGPVGREGDAHADGAEHVVQGDVVLDLELGETDHLVGGIEPGDPCVPRALRDRVGECADRRRVCRHGDRHGERVAAVGELEDEQVAVSVAA